ncbi:hypothetical protein COOONC_20214 [Cooperia oncophora]
MNKEPKYRRGKLIARSHLIESVTHQNPEMASAMKFCYYSKNQVRRTLSTSPSVPDTRLEEFKRKFRRSGSIGIPFVPEDDIKRLCLARKGCFEEVFDQKTVQ